MKRVILLMIFTVGAAAVTAFSQEAALPRLAVVEFSTNVSTDKTKADAITVRNLVESQMVATGKYEIITRDDIDKLLENQKIQVSAISSAENLKKLELANINYIVTGSLDAMDSDYAITVRVLDVSSGRFSHSDNDFMGSASRDLYTGITELMAKFTSGMSADESGVIVQGTSVRGSYNVGDKGPGGGVIFRVVGNTYLEVSKVSEVMNDYNWNDAVKMARNYRGGNFTNWRLPGNDELNEIYVKLQKTGLVYFGDTWHWSLSQYDDYDAWGQYFSDGRQVYRSKNYTVGRVLAVRAFSL